MLLLLLTAPATAAMCTATALAMPWVSRSETSRAYKRRFSQELRRRQLPPNWAVVGRSATGQAAHLLLLREQARQNINSRWQDLKQLSRLGEVGASPGWALRTPSPVHKPTRGQFSADPGLYLLHLLDRAAIFVDPKWKRSPQHLPGGQVRVPGCLRFAMKYALFEAGGNQQVDEHALNNVCLPLAITPRQRRRRLGPRRRRTYFRATPEGYMRVYLGTDKYGKPVKEFLHRLVLVAFAAEAPGPAVLNRQREACHDCCHPWCGNKNHLRWATHSQNQRTVPATAAGNQGNV